MRVVTFLFLLVSARPRMRMLRLHRKSRNTGSNIRDYVFTLASDNSSIFARSITNFIQCTREGSACELHVILRNIRQFINGMKNYLVKHGEADFHNVVLHERIKLCSTEFLNLDAILEGVLEQLVVHPLHDFLRQTFHNNSNNNNSNINDSSNSARAGVSSLCVSCSGADPQMSDFCDSIKSHTALLSGSMDDSLASSSLLLLPRGHSNKTGRVQYPTMGSFAGGFCSASQGRMSRLIRQLQATVSPLDKLELFLHLVAALFENHWPSDRMKSVKTGAEQAEMSRQVSVDEVLARLLNALLVCRASGIEFECEYMSGLVQPVLKTGQCGVYLAILSSAVHVVQAMRLFLDRVNARNHHSPSLHKTLNNNNSSSSSRGDRGDSSVCSGSSNRGGELVFSTDKITPSATDSASNNSSSSHTPKTAVEQQNQSVRVLVPDESRGTIITRTLTATLSTSARELCCLLADKLRISCPLDYALYQLVDGQETLLNDSDYPQQIKLNLAVKQIHCVLAYKRIDAKIAWPTAQL